MLSKEMLKQAVMNYDGSLLVVSHDREFLSGLTTRTIEFRDHRLIEYLGDVNYFLDKRAARDMRQVEMRTRTTDPKTNGYAAPDESGKGGANLSPEEKKNLQRTVQRTEKRIGELEAEIKSIESDMADSDFYNRPGSQAILKKYDERKSELTTVLSEWEHAVEMLG
jgi:ATP-binding cassette, subfamily F, member 3